MKTMVYDDVFFTREFDFAVKYIFEQAKKVFGKGLSDENAACVEEYASKMRQNYRIINNMINKLKSCFIRENTEDCRSTRWENENRKRRLIRKYLVVRTILRKMKKDIMVQYSLRVAAALILDSMPKNSALTRMRRRDMISGYPRAYVKKFGLSRHNIKHLFAAGELPGVTGASW